MLFTGGKDSTFAVHWALREGLDVRYLLTMVSDDPHSWMFHRVNVHHTPRHAKAIGIRQLLRYTSGGKERELEDLGDAIAAVKADVDAVVSGAIASVYQRDRISAICRKLGLAHLTPLWGRDPIGLLREITSTGFEVIITAVAAEGLTEGWLGRKLDEKCMGDLLKLQDKYRINISGEGGEYESMVLDAPFFKSRIEVLEAERVWRGTSGYYLIKRTRLAGK